MSGANMTLAEKINHQRVKYIVSSYQLDGDVPTEFLKRLDTLADDYPLSWLELALAEVLVLNWLIVPMPRGLEFLQEVKSRLQQWRRSGVRNLLTPSEFQRITNLDPSPVFSTLSLHSTIKR